MLTTVGIILADEIMTYYVSYGRSQNLCDWIKSFTMDLSG